jgi:hypothetical protein
VFASLLSNGFAKQSMAGALREAEPVSRQLLSKFCAPIQNYCNRLAGVVIGRVLVLVSRHVTYHKLGFSKNKSIPPVLSSPAYSSGCLRTDIVRELPKRMEAVHLLSRRMGLRAGHSAEQLW